MKQYFVYILLCSDNSYYTGITNEVFHERFTDVNQAIAFEKQVKGWKRAKKEAIINGNWEALPDLSVRKK